MSVTVCVGSSCYVRGAEGVAETLDRLVRDAGLDAQVELAGAFCMEHCSMGISVRVGDRVYSGLLAQDAERFFAENVLSRVAAQEGNSAGAIACLPR